MIQKYASVFGVLCYVNGRWLLSFCGLHNEKGKFTKILNFEENSKRIVIIKGKLKSSSTSNESTTTVVFVTLFMPLLM